MKELVNVQIETKEEMVIDSREVAEMLEKRHADLLRTIDNYVDVLTNAKLRSLDFFIKDEYLDGKGEKRPCYLLTRQGCEMIANKATGDKGILFTAKYVERFNKMERQLKEQQAQINQKDRLLLDLLVNGNININI